MDAFENGKDQIRFGRNSFQYPRPKSERNVFLLLLFLLIIKKGYMYSSREGLDAPIEIANTFDAVVDIEISRSQSPKKTKISQIELFDGIIRTRE